jgi:hypothetical protein
VAERLNAAALYCNVMDECAANEEFRDERDAQNVPTRSKIVRLVSFAVNVS